MSNPSMTRMHFKALADVVNMELDFLSAEDRYKVAIELKRFCNQFNHNFDGQRFIDACGVVE